MRKCTKTKRKKELKRSEGREGECEGEQRSEQENKETEEIETPRKRASIKYIN